MLLFLAQDIEDRKTPAAAGSFEPGCGGGGKKAAAASPGVFQLELDTQASEARTHTTDIRTDTHRMSADITHRHPSDIRVRVRRWR